MTLRLALFQLAGKAFALDLALIEQVVSAPRRFSLPGLAPSMAGVFLQAGRIIPALTAAALAGKTADRSEAWEGYYMICSTEFGPLGLPADRVLRVVQASAGALEPAPSGAETDRIFHIEGERYPLLRLETLPALRPCRQD